MKNISILVSFLLTVQLSMVNAQTGQGRIMVGLASAIVMAENGMGSNLMTLGYSTSQFKSDLAGVGQTTPDKTGSLYLAPKLGYFVFNNLALGIDINSALSVTRSGGDSIRMNENLFSVGPFIRYYIPAGKVLPFFEANSSFGGSTSKTLVQNKKVDGSNASIRTIGGGIGMAELLGKKATFDIMAGYTSTTTKDKDNNPSNIRTIIGTIGLKFGFIVLLGSD